MKTKFPESLSPYWELNCRATKYIHIIWLALFEMTEALNLFQFRFKLDKVSCSTKELLFKGWVSESLLHATTRADKFIAVKPM